MSQTGEKRGSCVCPTCHLENTTTGANYGTEGEITGKVAWLVRGAARTSPPAEYTASQLCSPLSGVHILQNLIFT